MNTKRFALTVIMVFVISQVFAIVIHGFILGPDCASACSHGSSDRFRCIYCGSPNNRGRLA
jgi:hypothetical protein